MAQSVSGAMGGISYSDACFKSDDASTSNSKKSAYAGQDIKNQEINRVQRDLEGVTFVKDALKAFHDSHAEVEAAKKRFSIA